MPTNLQIERQYAELVLGEVFVRLKAKLARQGGDPRILEDPVKWVRDVLHHDPWEKQEEVIRSVFENARTTVRSCHGVGKTFIAADVAEAFFHAYDDAIVITTAPTQRQVSKILWGYLRTVHQSARLGGTLLRTELRVTDRHYMMGFATREPEQFQGLHGARLLIIVDEASGLKPEIEDAIEGAMAGGDTHLLLIGNPTRRTGFFYESHTAKRHLYHTIHISASDSPEYQEPGTRPYLVGKPWAEERREEWGEDNPLYQVRVLGEFPSIDEYGLAPVQWLDAAEARDFSEEEDALGTEYAAALDVARYGSDENVLYLRRGWQVVDMVAWSGIDLMATVARAQEELLDRLPEREALSHLWVDSTGLGGGVADRLRELHWPVRDFVAGGSPSNADQVKRAKGYGEDRPHDEELYLNRRAEAFWKLRDRLRRGHIGGLTDGRTQSQLTTITWKVQSDRVIAIESKEQMRRRKLPSPDRGDALAMAFYEEESVVAAAASVPPLHQMQGGLQRHRLWNRAGGR